MMGPMLFTDKNHILAQREIFPALPVPAATRLSVGERAESGFLGFGVAITPSSCYLLSKMEPEERKKLLAYLYGKDGLGLGIGRLCIGSSDYSPEMYSYDDVEGDTSLAHFSIERDESYVIPMIKEILEIRPDLYLFASPWSPPYWMKTEGNMCGGFMRDMYLDTYADYIIKFLEAYEAHGIHISALTPQNEPLNDHGGTMPGCVWPSETEANFIKILKKKLHEKGKSTEVWMLDHAFHKVDRAIWCLENSAGLAEVCDGVAFHYYSGTIEQTYTLKEKFPAISLHFTEGGPRLNDNYDTDHGKWGLMAVKALKMGYRSFTGWNLMLDEMGGPNIGPFIGICGGLVTRNSESGDLSYSGQYRAFSHIAPFITKESEVYPISVGRDFNIAMTIYPTRTFELEGVLIKNPDGRQIAVLVNPNDRGLQTQIEIGGRLWYVELAADSVSTLIIE